MPKQEPRLFIIPAGTRPSKCNGPSCGATIYWGRNPVTGRAMPLSCDVPGGEPPSESKERGQLDAFSNAEAQVHDGLGCSHFLNCIDAAIFSHGGAR